MSAKKKSKLQTQILVTAASAEMPLDPITVCLADIGINSPVGIDGARVASVSDWLKKVSARGSSNPGRALQLALGEIFLANMDAHSLWGWADHRNTEVLDFLREFDDQIRFLLVVESPKELLARLLLNNKLDDSIQLDALRRWRDSVESLIRFNRARPDISLLTNSLAWAFDKATTFGSVADWLGIECDCRHIHAETPSLEDRVRLLLSVHASVPAPELDEVDHLWQEVLALSPSPEVHQISNEIAGCILALSKQTKNLESAVRDLSAQLAIEKSRLRNDPKLEAELQDMKEENNILFSQLHQVQEELERYFLMNKESEENLRKSKAKVRKLKRQLSKSTRNDGPHWDYDDLQLVQYMTEPGYESIWLAIQDASFGDRKWLRYEFRLSAANVTSNGFSAQPHYEFPMFSGEQQAFENWFIESNDDVRGERFELRFNLEEGAMDLAAWKKLSNIDRLQLVMLMMEIPLILDDLAEEVSAPPRGWEPWKQLNQDALKLLRELIKK